MVAAQSAPIGLQQPVEGSLDQVPHADTSKFDRPAVRAPAGEQTAQHNAYASVFALLADAGPALFRTDGVA
jgi:hypothetical protein